MYYFYIINPYRNRLIFPIKYYNKIGVHRIFMNCYNILHTNNKKMSYYNNSYFFSAIQIYLDRSKNPGPKYIFKEYIFSLGGVSFPPRLKIYSLKIYFGTGFLLRSKYIRIAVNFMNYYSNF